MRAGHTQSQPTQELHTLGAPAAARCQSGGGGMAQRFGLTTFLEACDTREQPIELSTHLKCVIRVDTYDYHGSPRISGGDPIAVEMQWSPPEVAPPPAAASPSPTGGASTRTSSSSLNTLASGGTMQSQFARGGTLQPPLTLAQSQWQSHAQAADALSASLDPDDVDAEVCDLQVMDNQDGSYLVHVTPERAGVYRLSISIVRQPLTLLFFLFLFLLLSLVYLSSSSAQHSSHLRESRLVTSHVVNASARTYCQCHAVRHIRSSAVAVLYSWL